MRVNAPGELRGREKKDGGPPYETRAPARAKKRRQDASNSSPQKMRLQSRRGPPSRWPGKKRHREKE